MQIHSNISLDNVNTFTSLPNIWDRNFDKEIASLGRANNVFIDIYKELRAFLGKAYEYVAAVIDLSRRFGYGFHCSNEQFIESTLNSISDRTLKRRKVEAKEFVTVSHTVKNRTQYYLNANWFKNFINGLVVKLGIQQGQFGPSHIISNDLKNKCNLKIHSHMDNDNLDNKETSGSKIETLCALQEYEETMLLKPTKKPINRSPHTPWTKFTHEDFYVLEKLSKYNTYVGQFINWRRRHELWQIESAFEEAKDWAKKQRKDDTAVGGYMHGILKNEGTENGRSTPSSGETHTN